MPTYDAIKGRRAGFVRVEVEAAFVHGDLYKREPERFSPQMRSYLDYGAKVSAIELMRTDRRIDVAAFELMRCFEDVDAIVSPTTPQAAPAFSDKRPDDAGTYCIPANFAGVPAISVPIGRNALGLPVGASSDGFDASGCARSGDRGSVRGGFRLSIFSAAAPWSGNRLFLDFDARPAVLY